MAETTKDPDHFSRTEFSLLLRGIQAKKDVVDFKFQVISTAKMPLGNFKNFSTYHSADNLLVSMAAIAILALTGKVVCSLNTKHL